MLRITQQTSSSGAKTYYSTADYFTEGHEIQGTWRGKGAEHLGLDGVIDQHDWDQLCENINPQTGEQLTARNNQYRRVGWDFTFDVPKSVSLVYALTKDQRILDAFTQSVDETMEQIESELHTRIRTMGQDSDRLTSNGIWGRFIHTTGRPVNGIPDPHLHAHCFLFNATYDGAENQWKAAQIADIKRDANYFNAVMHSKLAMRLVEMGLPIERTQKSWRITGLDDRINTRFSRRTRQINDAARQLGIIDPALKAQLGATTREGKQKDLSFDQLRTLWMSQLTIDESQTLQNLQRGIHAPREITLDHQIPVQSIAYAIEHHTERESVVPERVLLTTALHHSIGQSTQQLVESALRKADVIFGHEENRPMVTSPDVLKEEQRMIRIARNGINQCDPLAPGACQNADHLYKDQREALEHLCHSSDQIMLLRGIAGTGKSTMLKTLKHNIELHGKKVFAFAPSSTASRDVLRSEGFPEAETVKHLLTNPKIQTAIQGNVLLIDEAGLIGTRTMTELFDLAERSNARIILSGDRFQHGAVERGAALRLLEQEAGIRSAELNNIIRQKDRYKHAVACLSKGRVKDGFEVLDELKWINEVDEPQRLYDQAAAEYLQATEAGKTVAVISPTHAVGDLVTQSIRLALRHEKKIDPNETTVLRLVNRNLTLVERQDSANYNDGDTIIYTQNAPGVRIGTRLIVGKDTIPLTQADRFQVYATSTLRISSGDLIRMTGNGSSIEGNRINNGQTYRVNRIDSDGTITLANGWHLGPQYGHLDHGYVTTSHASQGKTRDRVIVVEPSSTFAAASREQFYVSVSRGRNHCTVLTDDKKGLFKAITDSSGTLSATELAARSRTLDRIRRSMQEQTILHTPIPSHTHEVYQHERR